MESGMLILLVFALGYLIYRIDRLERHLGGGSRVRRPTRMAGEGKVIPILKDQIEPGPFRKGQTRPESTSKDSDE